MLSQEDSEIAEGYKIITQTELVLKKKTHKEIGNFLVRFYNNTTFQAFKVWKRKTIKERQVQAIIKRTIEHMRKQQMLAVRSAFKSFVTQEVQKAKHGAIKSVRLECEQELQYIKYGNEVIEKER